MVNHSARFFAAGAATVCLAAGGAGVAAAESPHGIPPPAPTLNVMAVSVGTTAYAAVLNAEPDHVCKSEPAGVPVGEADQYGQAIVGPYGLAAFTIAEPAAGDVRITCGPQFSEFTRTGTAPLFPMS